jgi:hypothetical protein
MKGSDSGLIVVPSSICMEGLKKHISQGIRCSGRDSNRSLTELESQPSPPESTCWVLPASCDVIQSLSLKQCRYITKMDMLHQSL